MCLHLLRKLVATIFSYCLRKNCICLQCKNIFCSWSGSASLETSCAVTVSFLWCNCEHRAVQRRFPHSPSSFCIAIWDKPLTHLTNTCHMLTLRVTATRPSSSSVTVTDPTWQLHDTIYIFTQYVTWHSAANLHRVKISELKVSSLELCLKKTVWWSRKRDRAELLYCSCNLLCDYF